MTAGPTAADFRRQAAAKQAERDRKRAEDERKQQEEARAAEAARQREVNEMYIGGGRTGQYEVVVCALKEGADPHYVDESTGDNIVSAVTKFAEDSWRQRSQRAPASVNIDMEKVRCNPTNNKEAWC